MRKIRWYMLVFLLLCALVGCGSVSGNQGQNQPTTRATSLPQGKGDGEIIAPAQSVASPTAAASATATRTPGTTPTVRPTPRATATVQSSGASATGTGLAAQLRQQLFALINQDRANSGRSAYTLNSTL